MASFSTNQVNKTKIDQTQQLSDPLLQLAQLLIKINEREHIVKLEGDVIREATGGERG